MDEPTASLAAEEVEHLFRVIRELSSQGIAIIYVTHRLHEIEAICGRVTVFKDGERVALLEREQISRETLVKAILGDAARTGVGGANTAGGGGGRHGGERGGGQGHGGTGGPQAAGVARARRAGPCSRCATCATSSACAACPWSSARGRWWALVAWQARKDRACAGNLWR